MEFLNSWSIDDETRDSFFVLGKEAVPYSLVDWD